MPESNAKEENRFQIAGLDERQRGFNRLAEVTCRAGSFQATFPYETYRVTTELCNTEKAALQNLIQILQQRGYRQLRSQITFRGGDYLGSQPVWVEYPDPGESQRKRFGLSGWFKKIFGFVNTKDST
ncbi:MAG TPA: hypothetical protein VGB26_03430 [Nitrospiria bacterium]|jgi:hypothetical protein